MDKNTIIGLSLIGLILVGFSIYNSPSEAEVQAMNKRKDSIASVEKQKQEAVRKVAESKIAQVTAANSDSANIEKAKLAYGSFFNSAIGENKITFIENDVLKIGVSNKGGRMVSCELKKYHTYNNKPLTLIDKDSSAFGIAMNFENRNINTDSLYFSPTFQGSRLSMRASVNENQYIEYEYALNKDEYLLDFNINMVGLNQGIAANAKTLQLNWSQKTLSHEKNKANESNVTSIFYLTDDDKPDNLSESSDDNEILENKTKWVSFKQQFFSQILVNNAGFDAASVFDSKRVSDSSRYTKQLSATLLLPYNHALTTSYPMHMYVGPNHFKTLEKYDLSLEKQINLGWGIIGWVNKYLVINLFKIFSGWGLSMGIVILLMTLSIKLLLSPLTFKAYLSSAKMKVLKPEMDELNEKYKDADPLKKQQEVMSLYRKAGVNPLGGCVPMLLQLPILLAMFRFFPASFELRQQGFLWAEDLSAYDSILNLPFTIPVYGNHVSLFTLLMTASTIIYTRMNSGQFGSNPQMEQMKWMMYLMPIIFCVSLNSYASGLSYYYFIANMLTFTIQYLMKFTVNDQKLHAQIQENKTKPTKKSKFAERLEQMQKQQQTLQEAQRKNKK
jgi:YidC/Oxa1 family membrane protein insertase